MDKIVKDTSIAMSVTKDLSALRAHEVASAIYKLEGEVKNLRTALEKILKLEPAVYSGDLGYALESTRDIFSIAYSALKNGK